MHKLLKKLRSVNVSSSVKVLWKGRLRHSLWSLVAEGHAEPQPYRDGHKLLLTAC